MSRPELDRSLLADGEMTMADAVAAYAAHGVSRARFYRWMGDGLRHRKVDGRVVFKRADVVAWVKIELPEAARNISEWE